MISSRKAENVEKTVKELQAEKLNVFGVPCHVGECLIADTSIMAIPCHVGECLLHENISFPILVIEQCIALTQSKYEANHLSSQQ
jgi:hypothetical protein